MGCVWALGCTVWYPFQLSTPKYIQERCQHGNLDRSMDLNEACELRKNHRIWSNGIHKKGEIGMKWIWEGFYNC